MCSAFGTFARNGKVMINLVVRTVLYVVGRCRIVPGPFVNADCRSESLKAESASNVVVGIKVKHVC